MNTKPKKLQSSDTITRATNSAPTVNDDISLGYGIGSLWFDTLTNILYSCTDATNGAAVWASVTGSGGGGVGSLLFSFTDTTGTTPPDATPIVIATYTIPAGAFVVGDVMNIQVGATIVTNALNSGNIRVELDGNILDSMVSNAADGASNDFILSVNGVVKAGNTLEFSLLKTRLLGGVESIEEVLSTGTIAFDPTVSNVVDFIVENTTLNAGLTGAFNNVSIEKITLAGGGSLGVWSSPITANVVYQATSDGFVVVSSQTSNAGTTFTVKTDSVNPPTTVRGGYQSLDTGGESSFTCPVRSGDYVLVDGLTTGAGQSYTIYWIPLS